MFSRAKRFNYVQREDLSAFTSPCSRNHPIHISRKRALSASTSKNDSIETPGKRTKSSECNANSTLKCGNSKDVDRTLNNVHQLETKMQNRCQKLNHLATSASTTRDGEFSSSSSRTSSPPIQEIQAVPTTKLPSEELCETIAILVYQKIKRKKKEKNLWQKGKAFWNNTKKAIVELVNK